MTSPMPSGQTSLLLQMTQRLALSDAHFRRICQLIYQRAGIVLADHKRDMVYNRLKRAGQNARPRLQQHKTNDGFDGAFDNHADAFAQQDVPQARHDTQQQRGVGHYLIKENGKDVVEDLHNSLQKMRTRGAIPVWLVSSLY